MSARAPGMRDTEYRREYPEGEALETVLRHLPAGVGVSVDQYPPYWDVVARIKSGTVGVVEYIVTETPMDGGRPQRISEPTKKRAEAKEKARLAALTFVDLNGGFGPELPWD